MLRVATVFQNITEKNIFLRLAKSKGHFLNGRAIRVRGRKAGPLMKKYIYIFFFLLFENKRYFT